MEDGGGGILGGLMPLVLVSLPVLAIAGMWKVLTKAGKPGWACLVPIYNVIVMLQIVGRPIWWIVLLLIPLVNVVVGIVLAIDTAKAFGKGVGFGLGLLFLGFIFYPILGFGDARYRGPVAG
ncbi:MAG: signal peptidase I [Candidatus Schekmanbacteria bacterium]|nr:signal peptidase I [Candidatus Schekmanbacteria bacterium]